ncbi:MAG: hypothetical protein JWL62_1840 [Hyphomicrobiales bacterium]|nr:hypothetical protein [Hyphomicrobiales bacterium]
MSEPTPPQRGIQLTPQQLKSRRARNIAIGLAVGFLVVLFYAITIVKLGPGVLQRPD